MTIAEEVRARFAWVGGHADVWRFFLDAQLFTDIVDALSASFADAGVTKVVGIESRGFILGPPVALRLGAGFAAIRKRGGLLPGNKIEQLSGSDYRGRTHTFVMQVGAILPGDVVLLVDDWAENGAQALAAKALVERGGGRFEGASLIVDDLRDDVRAALGNVHAVVARSSLPPDDEEGP